MLTWRKMLDLMGGLNNIFRSSLIIPSDSIKYQWKRKLYPMKVTDVGKVLQIWYFAHLRWLHQSLLLSKGSSWLLERLPSGSPTKIAWSGCDHWPSRSSNSTSAATIAGDQKQFGGEQHCMAGFSYPYRSILFLKRNAIQREKLRKSSMRKSFGRKSV